jgi:ubiquinone biosynthesis protein UbiJ
MRVISNMPVRGDSLLLVHVQALASDAQRQPPQTRLSDRVGPGLAGLLVHALRGDHGAPRSGLRI